MEFLAKSSKETLSKEDTIKAKEQIEKLKKLNVLSEAGKNMLALTYVLNSITIDQHHQDLLDAVDSFPYKSMFSAKDWAMIRFCCKYHDLGKLDELFQMKVRGQSINYTAEPHGHLSIFLLNKEQFYKECPEADEIDFSVCMTAIFHHHTRPCTRTPKELYEYSKKYLLENARKYFRNPELKLANNLGTILFYSIDEGMHSAYCKQYRKYQLIKGMLNYFDYIASADIEVSEMPSDMQTKKLVKAIKDKHPQLRPAQEFLGKHADKNAILIGSTGIGKTEAACLWADGAKTIYTLPTKVSTTAIYHRIHDEYGLEDARVLHSGALDVYLSEMTESKENAFETLEAVSMFTSPFTVCTGDQLFLFAYQAPGTERFAASMRYSKVIIDELQSYSPETVAAIIYALVQIVEMGGNFCIITATLPEFFTKKLNEALDKRGLSNKKPVIGRFPSAKKRHMIHVEKDMDFDRIAKESLNKKVLVICNTVNKAIDVEERLKHVGAKCLHARYLPRDRRELERLITDFANGNDNGVWVTTQIVEASLDIDFDMLFTENCGVESLIQRMGRVFRDGSREPVEPNIIVCETDNTYVYDKEICKQTSKILPMYADTLLSEEDKMEMINQVFDENILKNSGYLQSFDDKFRELNDRLPNSFSLQDAQQQFRGIDKTISVVPTRIYEENNSVIETLVNASKTKGLSRGTKRLIRSKLFDMTISVHPETRTNLIDTKNALWPGVYRTAAAYDFDCETKSGRGLLEEAEKEAYFEQLEEFSNNNDGI